MVHVISSNKTFSAAAILKMSVITIKFIQMFYSSRLCTHGLLRSFAYYFQTVQHSIHVVNLTQEKRPTTVISTDQGVEDHPLQVYKGLFSASAAFPLTRDTLGWESKRIQCAVMTPGRTCSSGYTPGVPLIVPSLEVIVSAYW